MESNYLILIRHGETLANVEGRMQGWDDDPLTERGQHQVRQITRRLAAEPMRATAIYTSSLSRARTTADAIGNALGLTPVALDELREINLGRLDGASPAELEAANRAFTSLDDGYPEGESVRQFVGRVELGFVRILTAHTGERVIVVTHGGVIATILAIWSGNRDRWREFEVDNCSYTEVAFTPQPRIIGVGDRAHLLLY